MLYGYDSPEAVCAELMEENRKLKAEIESLKAESAMADGYADALVRMTKAEAIEEFAEKLKNKMVVKHKSKEGYCVYEFDDELIDNLVKKMEAEL